MDVKVTILTQADADLWPRAGAPFPGHLHVFQTRDYLDAWTATIGAARRARVLRIYVEADGAPLMLLPLAIERRWTARILTFPDGGVVDYNAPVLYSAAARLGASDMAEIWRAIRRALPRFDAAVFDKMPEMVAGAANPFRFLASASADTCGHVVNLPSDWSLGHLHRAKDSRRKRRRLAELGTLRFLIARDQAEADRLQGAMIRLKTNRYLNTRGVDGFERPGYRAYFRRLTQQFHPTGIVHLSGLEVAGEIVAAHWGLATPDRFYCLMLAYREECAAARYSPGRILIEELMGWCVAQGIRQFDLGFGDAPWKDLLSDGRIAMVRAVEPVSLLGWLYAEAAGLRRALHLRRTRMRPGRAARPAPFLP